MERLPPWVLLTTLALSGCGSNVVDTSKNEHRWRCAEYLEWSIGLSVPEFFGLRGHYCELQ